MIFVPASLGSTLTLLAGLFHVGCLNWRAHLSGTEGWSRGQGQGHGGAHRSSSRSQIDDARMFLPEALAGDDSQEGLLSDPPSSITRCLRVPRLARGSVVTNSSIEGHLRRGGRRAKKRTVIN